MVVKRVRNGVRKGNEVAYRLVNLRACVQLGHISEREHGGMAARRQGTAQTLTINRESLLPPSWAFRVLVGRSPSSVVRTMRLGVGERRRREIAIWSPQRPRAASIARFGQECSRSQTTTWDSGAERPHFLLFICSTCLSHFLVFLVSMCADTIGCLSEASRRSDIGWGVI